LKETGVNCPLCQGAIVQRRTKRGKTFYGCANYPECQFTTWDTPLKENCETCGSFKVRHNFKGGRSIVYCGNEACTTRVRTETEKPKAKAKPKSTKKAGGKRG